MDVKRFLLSGNVVEVARDGHIELGLCMPDGSIQFQELRLNYEDFEDENIYLARIYQVQSNGIQPIYINMSKSKEAK